jgi:hypothetical protein
MYDINDKSAQLIAQAHGLYLRLRDRAAYTGEDAAVKRAYHRYERRVFRLHAGSTHLR